MNQNDKRRLPRQKRSIEKVGAILDAVETLVVEHGPDAVTTTQIADVTGFAVGTIYQYFSNRTDILMGAHDRMLERMSSGVADAAANTDIGHGDSIDHLIRLYVETAKSYPGYLSLLKFAHANQSLEHSGSNIDAFVGDLVRLVVLSRTPNVCEQQLVVTRTVVVNLLSVLTDVVLLEDDPELQERFLREMIAHCTYALDKVGEAGPP
ncbi:MAG: TetR/AcrR family transcriptional regulator [Alphaproteobacteria bacterium]|nr:TetR/AcrR family transcriptional regulator [Alphaproteobacteria bacterium]